jgi:hypothetical protein
MSDPARLREGVKEEVDLEKRARWDEMPKELEAKVLFTRSLLDLVAGHLSGDIGEPLRDEIGARIRRSRTLDPRVDEAWKDQLSPKLKSWLPERTP